MKFLCLILPLLCVNGVFCQDTKDTRDAAILEAGRPAIPAAAKKSGLGGRVTVRVKIDKSGKVASADLMRGPDTVCAVNRRDDVIALRNAARDAALATKFSPAIRDGKPVESEMALNFDFPKTAPAEQFVSGGVRLQSESQDAVTNSAAAQIVPATDKDASPKMVTGGVLNGRALSLPKSVYPPAAVAVRATGTVNVHVLIDHDGTVFSAEPLDGHPLLRAAALGAACESRFAPTLLSGQPVKVSGTIKYHFLPAR